MTEAGDQTCDFCGETCDGTEHVALMMFAVFAANGDGTLVAPGDDRIDCATSPQDFNPERLVHTVCLSNFFDGMQLAIPTVKREGGG